MRASSLTAAPQPVARTISEGVAAGLRAAIVSGELPAGTRLRQVPLAKRFGVSTTPVREALAQLQLEGLVELHPQRGAVVVLPALDEFREHYEIRIALESLAAAKAAERFELDWARPLQEILDEMRGGPPAPRYLALNQQFHSGIYEHAARPTLAAMIARLRNASRVYLNIYRATEDFPVERLDREHRAILTACVRRDAGAAAEATRVHLQRTVDHVAARLEPGKR
jgi:DNA-binding GntR family transcriptional regulator